jgi:hypothetical protein
MTTNQNKRQPRREYDAAGIRKEHIAAAERLNTDELLTPREAAPLLRTTAGVLAIWRFKREKQLPFVRWGKRVYYRASDIQAFINRQLIPGDSPKTAETLGERTPQEPSRAPARAAKKRKAR